jgi:hypothetical protein
LQLEGEILVHLEAGELAPWAVSVIAPLVQQVVCSHPQSNAWIAKDADKCDRIDAFKLADLLRLNRFKEVHYPAAQSRRDFKTLVQHYDEMTAQQARLKTKLKARLRMQGVIVRGERGFSVTGREAVLAAVRSPAVRSAINQLYTVLDQSVASQTEARMLMLRAAQALPEIKIMKTAPWRGADWCLSVQCLYPRAAALQLHTQTLEVLPAECESSEQQWETAAPAAIRS